MVLDLTKETTLAGLIATLVVLGLTIFRQRRFEMRDLGSFGAAYFSGSNMPAAVYLFWYAFDPDPSSMPTKLHGYEKYVAFAGLSLLILSSITLWTLCQKAYALEPTSERGNEDIELRTVAFVDKAPNPSLKRTPDGAA
jgi:hypothetical protein